MIGELPLAAERVVGLVDVDRVVLGVQAAVDIEHGLRARPAEVGL